MAELKFLDQRYTVDDYDTVLNTLLKNGHAVPNACRGGHCHSCLMKATAGQPMPFSQMGLDQPLVDEGYFLACQCMIYADIDVSVPDRDKRTRFTAMVSEKTQLSDQVIRLRLKPARDFAYKSGQYLTLTNIDGLADDYPIASIHLEDGLMEFHITKDGSRALDHYIFHELEDDDALEVQTAFTKHHYQDNNSERPLVLITRDIDLAGAFGLLREALHKQHTGNIHILHIRETLNAHYLEEQLTEIISQNGHVSFHELQLVAGEESDKVSQLISATLEGIENTENLLCFLWNDNENSTPFKNLLPDQLTNSSQLIVMEP